MRINPADLVDQPEKIKKEAKYLTVKQLHTFLNIVENKYYKRMFEFAARTGMRRGEILGLQWSEIDFEKNTIKIKQTLQRIQLHHTFASLLKENGVDLKIIQE